MATIKDMVADTKRMAYGTMVDQINLIGTEAAAGATEITLDMDVSPITAGLTLSSGLNVWFVKGTDVAARKVFVIPGYDNSPSEVAPVGQMVYIKPRVTDWYMFTMLNREILRLSSPDMGLYKIGEWTSPVDPTWQTYDIPAEAMNLVGILRIRYRMPGTPDVWIDVPEKAYRMQIEDGVGRIRLLRNIPSGTTISFLYKGPFTQATSLADDPVADCGLSDTMVDIPSLGVLTRLVTTTQTRRNQVQQQGDPRIANEVSGAYNLTTAMELERQYKTRVWQEAGRLAARISIARSL